MPRNKDRAPPSAFMKLGPKTCKNWRYIHSNTIDSSYRLIGFGFLDEFSHLALEINIDLQEILGYYADGIRFIIQACPHIPPSREIIFYCQHLESLIWSEARMLDWPDIGWPASWRNWCPPGKISLSKLSCSYRAGRSSPASGGLSGHRSCLNIKHYVLARSVVAVFQTTIHPSNFRVVATRMGKY